MISAKWLQVALGWSTLAFLVVTVVLAVQKPRVHADLQEAKIKLDYLEAHLEGEIKPRVARSLLAYPNVEVIPNVDDDDEIIDYRLPQSLKPLHYKLYLHPDIETGEFSGQEVIEIKVLETTKQIILHAHKLQIERVYVNNDGDENFEVSNYELDTVREFLIINMAKELQKDAEINLGILFNGQMMDKIVGLYSSSYLAANSERRTIATSKFEPTYARQAFPCFDEPAMKAKFTITLVRPSGDNYHALSNMNEESSAIQGLYTEVYFAPSVEMSTYLACFIVSDFSSKTLPVEPEIGNSFNIRIFATSHQMDKVDFALNTAVAATEFYIKYFKVQYPLPKLDMAAIPDFVSNAMEHWGLVTYRETALLYDKSFSSTWNKQRVAAVIAHELAHMWFGNLVTMMWWNDLWLNEGFARYMEYKAINEIYSQWGMPDQFLIHALHSVMKFDSSTASHPIIHTVENPDQITEMFDTISYEKGASIIRMLEDVVGGELFAEGVSNYLGKFKFGNAVTDDFITQIENLNLDFEVKLFMRTWTEQMGLPVVNVKRATDTTFTLTQKRFFSNLEDYNVQYDDSEFDYTWTIPLTYYSNQNTEQIQRVWFDYTAKELTITVSNNIKWLKFNVDQIGYYRVNYEESIWREIIAVLQTNPEQFSIADRAHIFNDAFSLADASQLSYEIALELSKYLDKESDFVPWYVAASKLQTLQVTLMYTEAYEDYLVYARNLIEKAYKDVTWEVEENEDTDEHLQNRLRVSILTAACALGVPDCLSQAAAKFNAWLDAPEEKPLPDLREIVYYYGMQQGKQEHWDRMWEIFVAEQDASEKTKLMYGLSAVPSPWLLYNFIELAADEQYVRRQDYFSCIQNIAANPVGEPIVWEYVRENWPDLVARFGLNERYLGRMIPTITERFASETKLDEMQKFFNKYPEAGAGTAARKQALETVKFNIKWLQENEQTVTDWLKEQKTI